MENLLSILSVDDDTKVKIYHFCRSNNDINWTFPDYFDPTIMSDLYENMKSCTPSECCRNFKEIITAFSNLELYTLSNFASKFLMYHVRSLSSEELNLFFS